jgi:DNA-binding response OmpR family regulator
MTVLVYSDDATVRERVRLALGRRPAADLPRVEWRECATHPIVMDTLDAGGVDLCILDGEAAPIGGMGVCRQIKDEIFEAPPVLLLIGRATDEWLATWSRAESVVRYPLDPILLADEAARLLRARRALRPTRS